MHSLYDVAYALKPHAFALPACLESTLGMLGMPSLVGGGGSDCQADRHEGRLLEFLEILEIVFGVLH